MNAHSSLATAFRLSVSVERIRAEIAQMAEAVEAERQRVIRSGLNHAYLDDDIETLNDFGEDLGSIAASLEQSIGEYGHTEW